MKPKETINLYRVISLLVIALVTFGVMGGLCAKSHLYPDEWLSMFFLTLIFLLVCMFELEYERKQKGISANTQTTFIRLSVTYTVSGGLIYAISYLPEFYRPVMIPVILLTAVSNSMVAVSFGLFFDLVLALTVGGSFYALAAYMMLTMLAAVLAQALKEKKYRMGVSLLTFFFSLMIPELFSYLSTKEMQKYSLLYAFGTAFLTFLTAAFLFHRLLHEADQEIESLLKENQISGLAPEVTQFLINSIVTSIMRAIGKNSQKTEFSETQKGLMEACQQGNVQRIQDDLEKLVQTVCRGITEQNEKKKENQKGKMYMEAKAYVQLHYSDPDLSVNSMADCLGVQSAYLSKIFKEMEDMKLSQYIHMVRLSHVRNMLEKGERLEQIAIKCGFGSQRTFLRIFKQYEGITPTQYREMKEKEETNA